MKTAVNTGIIEKTVGVEKAVELIAKSGFDAWDLSLDNLGNSDNPLTKSDYLDRVRTLKRIGEDNGIKCNQSHAPFPVSDPHIRDLIKKSIECTAEAGGEIIVIHPDNDKSAEQNAEFYLGLLPFAKACGVKIATENMWNWNAQKDVAIKAACSHHLDFKKHLDIISDPYFVACLDIGHAEMKGLSTSALDMINTLGSYVQALHIHDNDKWHDSHAVPQTMDIDFVPIVKALKKIGYSGYFTLEVAPSAICTQTETSILKSLKDVYNSVKRLADVFMRA